MITYVDKELALPISVRNYGWPDEGVETSDAAALDEATLIEYYGYTEIRFETRLSDADFGKLRLRVGLMCFCLKKEQCELSGLVRLAWSEAETVGRIRIKDD